MNIYDVYNHPVYGYSAVKQGWCWPAFIFTWIWALASHLWGIAIFTLILLLFANWISINGNSQDEVIGIKESVSSQISCISDLRRDQDYDFVTANEECENKVNAIHLNKEVEYIKGIIALIIGCFVLILLGWHGNELRGDSLINRGYKIIGETEAASKDAAVGLAASSKPIISIVNCIRKTEYDINSLIDILVGAGNDIDAVDNDGNTALFHAIQLKKEMVAVHLIDKGINVEHRNKAGLLASEYAEKLGFQI